jgi:hypothetical protein
MRNTSDEMYRENKRKISSKTFSENVAVFEIMWKNVVEPDRPQRAT